MRALHYGTVIVCCVFMFCGIFSPRDEFEEPGSTLDIGDPYSFADLLKGSGETFSKLDWYDLFDNEFKYTNVRLANIVYDKSKLVNRLLLQYDIYRDSRRVVVKWENREGILTAVDMITLRNVSYTIALAEAPSAPLFSGNSGFVIVRGSDKIWRIQSWTDEPSGEAFFSPDPE